MHFNCDSKVPAVGTGYTSDQNKQLFEIYSLKYNLVLTSRLFWNKHPQRERTRLFYHRVVAPFLHTMAYVTFVISSTHPYIFILLSVKEYCCKITVFNLLHTNSNGKVNAAVFENW